MKVSIRDISRITGYSPATVSNALNYKKGVNRETAAEIFRVAKETGYINENSITKIKLVIFRRNGSIIEDTPFFPAMITGFEQECRKFGYEMVICNVDQRDPDYKQMVHDLINETGSAIVVLATEMQEGDLEIYKKAACPLVVMDCWTESMEFNAVLINNEDSAKMATEYLICKGHKKIGYLRSSFRIKGFRSRFYGYQVALKKHKIELEDKYIFTVTPNLNGAYQDMLSYLDSGKELPTAFFADNDLMALGAMKALQERGYRIPEDVSMVGFDDLPFSEISTPRLTTLRVPNGEMGQLAVRRIVDMIEKKDNINVKTQVCTRFIVRDTVKDLNS
ncbi:LacI family DNA-binding transcriptional regulator [Lachnospiraceae bacterium 62-35]